MKNTLTLYFTEPSVTLISGSRRKRLRI